MTAFGRYDLLALLSSGPVAEIWLARQRGMAGFEKLVVVKRLHARLQREADYVDAFLDEARINLRLQHTNVLQTYELDQIDGQYFLAMEYVEGLPLGVMAQRTISRLADIPIAIAGGLVIQAAQGIHYAHQATTPEGNPLRVVHRDLSPLNLLVSWDGIVKIADFGSARADGRRVRTRTGNVKGTPTYMSPEQVTGQPLDHRSDIFGLGILLWELVTGRRLFKRDTPEQTYDAITRQSAPPPSSYRLELSASLDEITGRALALRPDDRYETAAELAIALEGALHREGLRAEAIDLRMFLDKHFEPERREHEELLQSIRLGRLAPSGQTPLFEHAEHGLDSRDEHALPPPTFIEGDTQPDSQIPAHESNDAEHPVAALLPQAAAAPSTAAAKKSGSWWPWILLLVVLVIAIAVLGILVGKRRAKKVAEHSAVELRLGPPLRTDERDEAHCA